MKKQLLATLFSTGIILSASAETWRFASEEAKKYVQDIYAQKFADVIKQESNGDINVKIYYYGQLGTENDIIELTANGTIQFVSVGTNHLGSYIPEVQAISLPYVLSTNNDVLSNILRNSRTIHSDLSSKFKKKNLRLLSMFSEGKIAWVANKAIRSPADFHGQKIRTFTSAISVETYKSFGATPTPLSWGEVYGALQLKTVDSAMNPPYFIYAAKWHEVQDYLIFPQQQSYIATVSTNNKWFNKLSAHKQSIVTKASAAAETAAQKYQLKINRESMDKIRQKRPNLKVIRLNETERKSFKAASISLHEMYYDIVANAYGRTEKRQARKDAKTILQSLLKEVKEIEGTL
ncbi:C4-dicarboxylate ABC transporter [Candidatus Endobugula sertula]|uniref:C4-dicarboxylate ABC transporter n=1 Tax=Candidatus Endobugula sertula TaxID=62101 RepID=A0A1D2QU52_9GAMM|nr:C4-dicarboxylate ABC transporter [Candidatus Endobugula sertula]